MTVTGNTAIYALLADPVAHVQAPQTLNAHFAAHSIDAVVVPVHVSAGDLHTVVSGLRSWYNLAGIGVTIPHKERMTGLVDELTDTARRCGATNVVRRLTDGHLVGTQLDGVGFGTSLLNVGFDPQGKTAVLLGAGGTAKAIAHDLAGRGLAQLVIINRTWKRAETLAESVASAFNAVEVTAPATPPIGADLVVNATSLGMTPDDHTPLDPGLLQPQTTVADVIMRPPMTPLLIAAERRGCAVHPGRLMLEAQLEATVQFLDLVPEGAET